MSNDVKNEPDITYKFILLGDTRVGKTCIFRKISSNKFFNANVSTIGIDYKVFNYEIEIEENGEKIKKKLRISLYDTAGQERYKTFTKNYINNSNGIILIYDITDRKSFDDVTKWVKSIEEIIGDCEQMGACMFLIGNKKDLAEEGGNERKVQINEAESLAETNGLLWGGECSAKNYEQNKFNEIFINFAKIIYSKYGYIEPVRDSITINKKDVKKKKKKSCKC